MDADVAEQADHIARPADRDDRRGKAIFEQQQRAHDPGGELADRRVAVGVGRAGNRQGRGQLGIAEAGKGADDAGDDVGDQHRRPGVKRRGVAGADEDARADDAADAEEDQVPGAERPLELAGLASRRWTCATVLRSRMRSKKAPLVRQSPSIFPFDTLF